MSTPLGEEVTGLVDGEEGKGEKGKEPSKSWFARFRWFAQFRQFLKDHPIISAIWTAFLVACVVLLFIFVPPAALAYLGAVALAPVIKVVVAYVVAAVLSFALPLVLSVSSAIWNARASRAKGGKEKKKSGASPTKTSGSTNASTDAIAEESKQESASPPLSSPLPIGAPVPRDAAFPAPLPIMPTAKEVSPSPERRKSVSSLVFGAEAEISQRICAPSPMDQILTDLIHAV